MKRKTPKRKRAGKRAPAPKRKKRVTAKKAKARARKPKPKKPTRRAKPTARHRSRTRTAPARTARGRAQPAAAPAAMPEAIPAAAAGDDMQAHVEQALRDQGYDEPDPRAVAVLAAIGRGYAKGPANPPAWLQVDVNGLVAEGMVERFAVGDRAHDIDRSTHRAQVRATVDMNLDQLGAGDTDTAERDAITSFCLGAWDPDMDANAERNGIASFVVPWYLAGRA